MTTLELFLIGIIIVIYLIVGKILNEILEALSLLEILLFNSNPKLFSGRKPFEKKQAPYVAYVWPLLFWYIKFNK